MSILKGLASNIGKLATQAATAVASGVDRMANRQEFDAVVAACVLVATADGTTSQEEKSAAVGAASSHQALKSFPTADVIQAFNEGHTLLGMDRDTGVEALLQRVRKITDLEARARIINVAKMIANSDGKTSAEEEKIIERMRS